MGSTAMNTTSFAAATVDATTIAQNITGSVQLYQVPPYLVVLLSICYGSISILATAGNGLVIWVIVGSHRMRNVTNYYIANLALADFLLAVFAIPFEVSSFGAYCRYRLFTPPSAIPLLSFCRAQAAQW